MCIGQTRMCIYHCWTGVQLLHGVHCMQLPLAVPCRMGTRDRLCTAYTYNAEARLLLK